MIRARIGRGGVGIGAALVAALVVAAMAPMSAAAAPKVGLKPIAKFNQPTFITGAPGTNKLLFVVEKEGTIRVVRDGKKLSKPFLNIKDLVSAAGEQGLLSMAFDPDYAENRRFYVFYTNKDCTGGGACNVEVDGFLRSPDSATKALKESRETLIEVTHHQQGNHNGGQLQFGPDDGYLYISVGDGGTQPDPEDDAQDPDSQLGKILRVDPTGLDSYDIPPGNPYSGGGGDPTVFSLGLRNPYRFSFDRATGDIWIADVGYQRWEEIDHETLGDANGANFGWNDYEGFEETAFGTPPLAASPEEPVHAYSHSGSGENGRVIIGGYVIRDEKLPNSLQGLYLYADNQVGGLRAYDEGADERIGLGVKVKSPASFGEDNKGRIYAASGPYRGDGRVYRLVAP
jgi:glucose/arabinose dehydrogenase